MANKRKFTTALVAGVTAAALMLGGTFAWTSISQQAKNEAAGIVNVGGRLHDDFGYASTDTSSRSINARSGALNKDVYVENFTDPTNGGQPIYARVKLTEYMEVGSEAGQADKANRKATPVVAGTKIDDKDNWPVHIPNTEETAPCPICTTGGTHTIHDHWTWTMGGEGGNNGQTTFMPTFNKDKDSLQADINGTFAGTDANDKVYYDDYVEYTTDETGKVFVVGTDTLPYADKIYQKTDTAYYDDDTDTAENDHENKIGVKVETETHTAKQTATAEVITMQQWIDEKDKAPGNYWVYDTDGWAYWANPIMPGEATGLLLDGIEMTKNPGEKCYYAINVVGQFATVNDWTYFTDGGAPSDDAKELLTAASQNVATVTVTNVSGETLLTPGESYEFSASVTVNGQQVLAASDFEWSVLNADGSKNTTSTIENGVLLVNANETSKNLIVVAKALDEKYLGALGMSSVAVDQEIDTTNETSAAAYAIFTDDGSGNGTYAMTFIRSNQAPTEGNTYQGKPIVKYYLFDENDDISYEPVWLNEHDKVTSVSFANTIAPVTMDSWFYLFSSLKSVDFTNLDGSNLKSMNNMFSSATAIESIDMSGVIVSQDNQIKIYDAFQGCTALKELKVPKNMTIGTYPNMLRTFGNCTSLTTIIGMETWDVSNVTYFGYLFSGCSALKNINLSGWKFGSQASLDSMFRQCGALEEIYGAADWDVSNVVNMKSTFSGCSLLKLDCSSWNVSNVTEYRYFNSNALGVTAPAWVN